MLAIASGSEHSTMIGSILIVEDVTQTRVWLRELVREVFDGAHVYEAGTVKEGLALCAEHPIDLGLIDLGLPDGDGFTVLRAIATQHPDAIPVVATVMGSDSAIVSALSAGAQGYILKSDPEDIIRHHLQMVVDGLPPLSPAIARRVMQHFKLTGPNQEVEDALSDREVDVLIHIAKGLRVSDTASALGVAPSTVSTHIKAIYRKLNISTRAEASLEATRMGLLAGSDGDT